MIRFKKPKIKLNLNKKSIMLSMIVCFILLIGVVPFNFYAGLSEILTGAIAFLIRAIASAVDALLTEMGCSINKLVFNVTDGKIGEGATILTDFNLSLLRGDTLAKQLFTLYNLFVYIAGSLLGCITLWVTFDFIKTANDIKHKAILKQRIKRLVLSIILLLSIPYLFDILMVINQTICDVFRVFVVDVLKAGTDFNGTGSAFKALSDDNDSDIVYAILYLMSTFLNVWLAIFYMIRDITIGFLFMLAPVIVILLPYRTDLVLNWCKELCSNIFTQAIQAFILSVEIAIIAGIANNSSLYPKIFALVSFAMFIPLTGIVKKMLGLEGELGAAKSNAGLGAATGALKLAGGAAIGAMALGSKIKSHRNDVKNINAEQDLLKKSEFGKDSDSKLNSVSSTSSKVGGGGRGTGVDPNNRVTTNGDQNVDVEGRYDKQGGYSATSRARQLQGMKRNARKEIFKTVAGGALGGIAGGVMALGSSVYGDSRASMGAAFAGASLGNALGGAGASLMNDGATFASEKIQDAKYGKGVRYDGESFEALDVDKGTKDLTEGTQKLSSPFDFKTMQNNVSTMRENHAFNKDVRSENRAKHKEIIKENKESAKKDITFATGNGDQRAPENRLRENKALLKRNELERRGNFDTAHRSYANNTYDRNNDEPPNMDISNLFRPEGSPISVAPTVENSVYQKDIPNFDNWKNNDVVEQIKETIKNPNSKPIQTPSYGPTVARANTTPMPIKTSPYAPTIARAIDTTPIVQTSQPIPQPINTTATIQRPQPINTTPTIQRPQPMNVNNNEIENLIISAKKRDIYMDMQSYDNNQQYIDSMKDYVYDVPSMFLDNDDNQLY